MLRKKLPIVLSLPLCNDNKKKPQESVGLKRIFNLENRIEYFKPTKKYEPSEVKLICACHFFSISQKKYNLDQKISICLFNNGDDQGLKNNSQARLTCSTEVIRDFYDLLTALFIKLPGRISLNTPISTSYSMPEHVTTSIPWLGIALDNNLFIDEQGRIDDNKVNRLNEMWETAFSLMCKMQEWI